MMSEDENKELEGDSIPGSKILRVSVTLVAILLVIYFVFFRLL